MFVFLLFSFSSGFVLEEWLQACNSRVGRVGVVGCQPSRYRNLLETKQISEFGCAQTCNSRLDNVHLFSEITGSYDLLLVTDSECISNLFDELLILVRSSGLLFFESSGFHFRRPFWIYPEAFTPHRDHQGIKLSHVTYASWGDKYDQCARESRKWALENWSAASVASFTPLDLSHEFRERAGSILSVQRGAGYWVWKPAIIWNQLSVTNTDYLIYSDACSMITESIQGIISKLSRSVFLVAFVMDEHSELMWTKGDVLDSLDCNTQCRESGQFAATFSIWKVGDNRSHEFLKQWSNFSLTPHLITDSPSRVENHVNFREHRHDQSIYSILVKKQLFADPASVLVLPFDNQGHHRWG